MNLFVLLFLESFINSKKNFQIYEYCFNSKQIKTRDKRNLKIISKDNQRTCVETIKI